MVDLQEDAQTGIPAGGGNPLVVSGRVKPTIKTAPMTNDEFTAAAMSRAAYIQYNEGEDAVRKYAAKNVGDGWTYDPELSNEMAVVFSRGNESAIAYRGTQQDPP